MTPVFRLMHTPVLRLNYFICLFLAGFVTMKTQLLIVLTLFITGILFDVANATQKVWRETHLNL